MEARRREPNKYVTHPRRGPIDDPTPVDEPDNETGEIVLAIAVETRHFGGLAAEEGETMFTAGHRAPPDDVCNHIGVEAAGGQVVEKKQRPRSLDKDVVDAVVDEITPHSGVPVGGERDLELGADTIR